MTAALLELRNIETFYGPIMAIRGVSLTVDEGEIVAVLGANGAGKTTLLAGEEIQNRDPDWVARQGIAHVPEGREVFPFLSVDENLAMGAYNRHDRDAVAKDIETVYGYFPVLKELHRKMAGYLSGGQQQMLAIGRGFVARPRLLLLDEPSLGLSPALCAEIFTIISRLNEEQGLTILLVEQNANAALKVSRRGYVMEVGGMVMDGESDHLLESEDIKEFYLGLNLSGGRRSYRNVKHYKRRKRWLG